MDGHGHVILVDCACWEGVAGAGQAGQGSWTVVLMPTGAGACSGWWCGGGWSRRLGTRGQVEHAGQTWHTCRAPGMAARGRAASSRMPAPVSQALHSRTGARRPSAAGSQAAPARVQARACACKARQVGAAGGYKREGAPTPVPQRFCDALPDVPHLLRLAAVLRQRTICIGEEAAARQACAGLRGPTGRPLQRSPSACFKLSLPTQHAWRRCALLAGPPGLPARAVCIAAHCVPASPLMAQHGWLHSAGSADSLCNVDDECSPSTSPSPMTPSRKRSSFSPSCPASLPEVSTTR